MAIVRKDTKYKTLREYSIPEIMFYPYKIGNSAIDSIFSEGGGIVPGQTLLLTGEPGGGKSTLAMYIAMGISDYIMNNEPVINRPHGPVVYISREMSDYQVKLLESKIKLGNLDEVIIITDQEEGSYLEWLEECFAIEPSLIILDSIQKHASELGGGKNNRQIEIAEAFNKYAKLTYTPVILIGHVSKSGDYIGPSSLKHELDGHLHISVDNNTGDRVLQFEKNRFGEAFKSVNMIFSSSGVRIERDAFDAVNLEDEAIENINETVRLFHNINLEKEMISEMALKKMLSQLFIYLKSRYEDKIKENKKIPSSIRLEYNEGEKFDCNVSKDVLTLGMKALWSVTENWYPEDEIESQYMIKLCRTREDKLMWIFLHHFAHLFKIGKRHSIEFYQEIYRIAKEEKFLFSTYLNEAEWS